MPNTYYQFVLGDSWPYLHSQHVYERVFKTSMWPCLKSQIAILSRTKTLSPSIPILCILCRLALKSQYNASMLLVGNCFHSLGVAQNISNFAEHFIPSRTTLEPITNLLEKLSRISIFLPYWKCIPSFLSHAISKRLKLQEWDCAHLKDFLM